MASSKEEYKNWEVIVRKAIADEEKTWGQPALQIKEVDQYSPQGHHPSLQANKYQQVKRQGQDLIHDILHQKHKPSSSAPQQCNEANRSKGNKFWYDKKLRHCQEQSEQNNPKDNTAVGSTITTGANSSGDFKKKDNTAIICYNCNKKGHISRICYKL